MFGFRKKETVIETNYYARIDETTLDFNEDLVQSLAEKSGDLVSTWPNASLADLQQFLSLLTNDIVRASNRNFKIGNITYFEKDNKGRSEPTGLSWDNAEITPAFENIAVATAEHIFNAASVRQDEETDYDTIIDALTPFLEAVLENTELSVNDMPVLPDAQQYRQAQEDGELITVEAKKFVIQQTKTRQPFENGKLADTEKVKEQANEPVTPSAPVETKTKAPAPQSTVAPVIGHSKEVSVKTPPTLVSGRSEAQKLIDQVKLQPQGFEISKDLQDVAPVNEQYVQAQINQERRKANTFLDETSTMYTQKVRKTLADLLHRLNENKKERLQALQQTDVLSAINDTLATERPAVYEERFNRAQAARKAGFDSELSDENARHEQTLVSLKGAYVRDIESLKVSVNQEIDDWYTERSKELANSFQASLSEDMAKLAQQAEEDAMTQLTALRDDLLTKNMQSLMDMKANLATDLDKQSAIYQKQHDEAVLNATKLAAARTQEGSLSELEKQIQVLKTANNKLESQLKAKDATSNQALTELQAQLTKALAEKNQSITDDKTNDRLLDILSHQMQTPLVTEVKTVPVWKPILVGLLSAAAITIAGIGGYVMAQHQNVPTHSAQTAAVPSEATIAQTSSKHEASSNANSKVETKSASSNSSGVSSSVSKNDNQAANNPLLSRFHVGQDIPVTINGAAVTAKIVSIQEKAITVFHDGYNYNVPMD
ncbi:hypothetical protein FGL72_04405 [Leuconostoc citreum]|uniref:hypothetical protein n=1 Tax=Leuconostoc citreum TaxID=33964 RepID=UPI00111F392E|nr:hypothetical protein [Leuconostoc citreum]QEA46396.1 hypothetical protein FGL82_08470 [Leuconostoc citreum]QEA63086.1 hypothetical protein FGL72_04405 [Leuconostoc citreum]TOY70476.1 hypothetical protein DIS12_03155 [Leuconostoc citreum]